MGLSLDVIDNITDNAQFHMKQNRINPVLLQQICNRTNGNFMAVDIYNEESVEKVRQGLMAYVKGEYGFDVSHVNGLLFLSCIVCFTDSFQWRCGDLQY